MDHLDHQIHSSDLDLSSNEGSPPTMTTSPTQPAYQARKSCKDVSLSLDAQVFIPSAPYPPPICEDDLPPYVNLSSVPGRQTIRQPRNRYRFGATQRRVLPTWLAWPSPILLDRQYLNQALYCGCRRKCTREESGDERLMAQPEQLRNSVKDALQAWPNWRTSLSHSSSQALPNQLALEELNTASCCYCQGKPLGSDEHVGYEPALLCNESPIPGLCNGTGMDFIIPVVYLFFLIAPVRNRILKHAHHANCELPTCLICELGFTYFTMLSLTKAHEEKNQAASYLSAAPNDEETSDGPVYRPAKSPDPGGPFPVSLLQVAKALRDIPTAANLGLLPGGAVRGQAASPASSPAKLFNARVLIFGQLLLDTLQAATGEGFRDDITCCKTTSVYCRVPGCSAKQKAKAAEQTGDGQTSAPLPSNQVYKREQPTFIVELKGFKRENGNGDTEVIGHRFAACLQAGLFSESVGASTTPGPPCGSCHLSTGQRATQKLVHQLSDYLLINCHLEGDPLQSWRAMAQQGDPMPSGGGFPLKLGISVGQDMARVFSLTATPGGIHMGSKQGRGCQANEELWRSIIRSTGGGAFNQWAPHRYIPHCGIHHYEYELVAMVCNVNPDASIWTHTDRSSGFDILAPEEGYPIVLMKDLEPPEDRKAEADDASALLKAPWTCVSAFRAVRNIKVAAWMKYLMPSAEPPPLTPLICVYKQTTLRGGAAASPPAPPPKPQMVSAHSFGPVPAPFEFFTPPSPASPKKAPLHAAPFKAPASGGPQVRILARPRAGHSPNKSPSSILIPPAPLSGHAGLQALDMPDCRQLYHEFKIRSMPDASLDWHDPHLEGHGVPSFRDRDHVVPLTPEEEADIVAGRAPFMVGLDAEFVKITVPSTTDVYSQIMKKQAIPEIMDPDGVPYPTTQAYTGPSSGTQAPKAYQRPVPHGQLVTLSLARVSVVRYFGAFFGKPIFDCYVQHNEQPFDCLTCFSGIKEDDLLSHSSTKPYLVSHKALYKKIRFLVDNGVTIVGHGLQKDFRIINIHVPFAQTVDTVHLFRLPNQRLISLKYLVWLFFGLHIQEESHDSVEDAVAALKLFKLYGAMAANKDITLHRVMSSVYAIGYKTKWKVPNEQEIARAFHHQNSLRTFPNIQPMANDDEWDHSRVVGSEPPPLIDPFSGPSAPLSASAPPENQHRMLNSPPSADILAPTAPPLSLVSFGPSILGQPKPAPSEEPPRGGVSEDWPSLDDLLGDLGKPSKKQQKPAAHVSRPAGWSLPGQPRKGPGLLDRHFHVT